MAGDKKKKGEALKGIEEKISNRRKELAVWGESDGRGDEEGREMRGGKKHIKYVRIRDKEKEEKGRLDKKNNKGLAEKKVETGNSLCWKRSQG